MTGNGPARLRTQLPGLESAAASVTSHTVWGQSRWYRPK